ncbi:hypothetical protein F4777DRAFT_582092 [Nemania sp. FL0916]|nr:hypothetical protein F4777DRAFT_582092 [Nemania sp. FL0916]
MASITPDTNARDLRERSRGRRIGALMDLSRGEPPLSVVRRETPKGSQKTNLPTPSSSRPRVQTSRIPQSPPTQKLSSQAEIKTTRPSFTHDTQSWSTSSRSGIPMAKPAAIIGVHVDSSRQPRNVLRRKQSTMLREPSTIAARKKPHLGHGKTGSSSPTINPQATSDSGSSPSDYNGAQTRREDHVPQPVDTHWPMAPPVQIYPELDRYRDIPVPTSRDPVGRDALYRLATEDLPPPTPQFSGTSIHSQLSSFSVSPSTRFSESPGPGPYSRDTTPTSMCSQSPGLVAPVRLPVTRLRQASPAETRPPVTRRKAGSVSNEGGSFSSDPQGLAAVREALTSSSSNSTVRAEEKKNTKVHSRHKTEPPNPPPRKSSQKFQKGRSVDETQSSFLSSQIPSPPTVRSPSPSKLRKPSRNRAPSIAPSPQKKPTPPSRPSRDGTPDLYPQLGGPVPIVHSNLSSTSLTEKRQSGQLHPSSPPKTIARRSSQDHAGSARPSFSQESILAPQTGIQPGSQASKNEMENTNRAPSPAVSIFKSKFPIFGRRKKAETGQSENKKEKIPRKGPAAGTGHEGYGRVGAVKRRSSTSSSFQGRLPGLVSSSESLPSTLSTDTFLLERMSPVIIAGGEVVENQNSLSLVRTESNQSIPWARSNLGPRPFQALSSNTREANRQTLWPSPVISEAVHSRRPSDNNDSEAGLMKSSLLYQEQHHQPQLQDQALANTLNVTSTRAPSVASTATTIHTDDSSPDIQSDKSPIIGQVEEPTKSKVKRAKSPRKWNLFGRNQTNMPSKKEAQSVSATVQPSQTKLPAFYTIMDSPGHEGVDKSRDVYDGSQEAGIRAAYVQTDHDRRLSTSGSAGKMSHMLPSKNPAGIRSEVTGTIPQIWRLETGQERRRVEQKLTEPSTSRPSRLPQVGRIPKVVASRPEQTSPKSFSRPFNRISVHLAPTPPAHPDKEYIAKGPSPPESVAPTAVGADSSEKTSDYSQLNERQSSHDDNSALRQTEQGFLEFSPREDLDHSDGSGSSCSSAPGYGLPPPRVPEPSTQFGEDEVWDEYNDLLQDVPPSPTSSCGVPFPLETYQSKLVKRVTKPLESPTIVTKTVQDARTSVATAVTTTTSSHHSAEMTARINAAFRFDSDPPVTPFSVSEFVSGYGDRNNSKIELVQEPVASVLDSSSSQEDEKGNNGSKRGSRSSNGSSESGTLSEETPLSQVNLRVGSMTVSKWLTFGHVLFSPVREDITSNDDSLKRQSILIIDGLGNDDWSFYAAETYPETNFYNLSPRAPPSQEHQTASSFPLSPSNHHQIQFMSHADKFPFGPDSFTALVFRFPSAAPKAHYLNIISEAQRVLKPGGFIELSVLDIDLNNVGQRTRRAVRHLKERASTQHPEFNLSSTADLVLRLLGKKGFIDIKTCRVGVPVASSITKTSNKDAKKDERSLAEMMNDKTELGDANIAKMVSKVGRWWYNKCYEVPTGMNKSIWHNRALLAECEEWGTSLKLMVCHARIPETKGRIASI